jgi:hypothetical protein
MGGLPVTIVGGISGNVQPLVNFYNTTNSATPRNIKNSPGVIYSIYASNVDSVTRYVKFFNTVNPIVGVTIPVLVVPVAARLPTPPVYFGEKGLPFSDAISMAITANGNDTDTTLVNTDQLKVSVTYL